MISPPVVVKFGGSLFGSPERQSLLRLAARAGAVLVPGGGPFADAVRDAQPALAFGDGAAHAMAMLAMAQAAHLLHEAEPALALCGDAPEIAAALARGEGAIWRPAALDVAPDLPASWDVTSDSLALWLAVELRAARLMLLKSAAAEPSETFEALAERGVVDPCAPALARRFAGALEVIGPATAAAFEAALLRPSRRAA